MKRLLIANRGEIAVRVIRAAKDLGIDTVAVHSSADNDATHVHLADQSVGIGPPQAAKSYLDIDTIVEAAVQSGADAIHPGYGFLSERAAFAQACEQAGLTFVGPTSEHIETMGDKARAREVARQAGVPTVPGSPGPVDTADDAVAYAREAGYPVMLKAAAGGGGRGIRVVDDEAALRSAFPAASAEAAKAFGDGRMYLERFIRHGRHVEVQVLGDGREAIHVFERECSLQRRRQKMLEEALAPGIEETVRSELTAAAVRLCKEVGYRSAGTVEFLVDADTNEFFFIEMNTRIQVEHPTTELVCGIDLVEEQLRIAAAGRLRLRQADIEPRGWALEFRICAEDASKGFLPSPGPINELVLPSGPWVRVDTWLRRGAKVSPFYDSLLAKVLVWGDDRDTALRRARRALSEFDVDGVPTTTALFQRLLEQPWVAAGQFDTNTLEAWLENNPVDEQEGPA